jgi:hypothetical protein
MPALRTAVPLWLAAVAAGSAFAAEVDVPYSETKATKPVPGANPVFRDTFTADPAVLVVGDTLYCYTGHDQAVGRQFFTMPDWLCYSTKDMKH